MQDGKAGVDFDNHMYKLKYLLLIPLVISNV